MQVMVVRASRSLSTTSEQDAIDNKRARCYRQQASKMLALRCLKASKMLALQCSKSEQDARTTNCNK